jgi:Family of unknown function (DUF5724)/Domain of unknown function (DUF4132)
MLTPKEAKDRIAQVYDRHSEKNALASIAALPAELRDIAYYLIDFDEQGKRFKYDQYEIKRKREVQFAQRFDRLDTADQLRIFDIFFPKCALIVERAWHDYPSRLSLNPLNRSPQSPSLSLMNRWHWLSHLIQIISGYREQSLAWFAHYAPYIGYGGLGELIAPIFAAAIDYDPDIGNEVYEILLASARGEDEIGMMGAHITHTLLAANRSDGWDFIMRMLVAAQRQEGLRQVILQAVQGAQPAILPLMLHTILDHDLARFSSVTLLVNQWFGTRFDSAQQSAVRHFIQRAVEMLDNAEIRNAALEAGSGKDTYLALWATATQDITVALNIAKHILTDLDVERRAAAVMIAAASDVTQSNEVIIQALADPDLRIVALAIGAPHAPQLEHTQYFEQLEAIINHIPINSSPLKPLIWEWQTLHIERAQVATMMVATLGTRDPRRLIPYLPILRQWDKIRVMQQMAEHGINDREIRAALFTLLRDRSSYVSGNMLQIFEKHDIAPDEWPFLEDMLTRKSSDLRQGILRMLLKQTDDIVLATVERLLSAKNDQQRLAGLEALNKLHENDRDRDSCTARARAYREAHPQTSQAEAVLLDTILAEQREIPTLANALGLLDPADLTPPTRPQARPFQRRSPAAAKALLALDALVHTHREESITIQKHYGDQELLLANAIYVLPRPDMSLSLEEDLARLPLREIWLRWLEELPPDRHDIDGLEYLRMYFYLQRDGRDLIADAARTTDEIVASEQVITQKEADKCQRIIAKLQAAGESTTIDEDANENDEGDSISSEPSAEPVKWRTQYANILDTLCRWFMRLHPAPSTPDFLLNMIESSCANLPLQLLETEKGKETFAKRLHNKISIPLQLARDFARYYPALWSDEHTTRLWCTLHWLWQLRIPEISERPTLEEALAAHAIGAASTADLYLLFLGPRTERRWYWHRFDELSAISTRRRNPLRDQYPIIDEILERCRERILSIELQRGDLPTAATGPALNLQSLIGVRPFVAIIAAIGKEHFSRNSGYNDQSRMYTLSHLLRRTFPEPADTSADLASAVATACIEQQRLVETAVYAPQWARLIEHVLGWDGFTDSVWWLHAHTHDSNSGIEQQVRDEWAAQIGERSPLSREDFESGAVDVDWFWRVYHALGVERWEMLYEASKYTSSSTGHARARLYADAMLGKVDAAAILKRIFNKRSQDCVRALGLLPLPDDEHRDEVLYERYLAYQEFIRTGKQFGPQRRENEKKAMQIGCANMARTAGYRDPARFQWAMEIKAGEDLHDGALNVSCDDVQFTLRIDQLGQPHLEVRRGNRLLKDIPAKLKKDPNVQALRERKKEIEQQVSRMRQSLEMAMCREDRLTVGELRQLMQHPVLEPMLRQLVFIGPDGMGYPVHRGQVLQVHDGRQIALSEHDTVRIAHPYDLYRSGEWSAWQYDCFVAERIQPFKQIFRELYLLTEAEERDGNASRRYAGQQVQPKQAIALLGTRGWIGNTYDYCNDVSRTFHEQGIAASLSFLFGGGTAVDVEGLTVDQVRFTQVNHNRWQAMAIHEVPSIIFSETMRDIDLMVSVAHRGGVDPETSQSTVEMRATLVRETCTLLKLNNVRIERSHLLIKGHLGEYSVHLGSGTVHLIPGGSLCIIPVHAQHRGRIFLPFADDDPKTAEIISKAVTLADDTHITDPLILQQIVART